MKKILLSILCIFSISLIELNAQQLEWAKHIPFFDNQLDIATTVDNSGIVISVGVFLGTIDIDPSNNTLNISSSGGYDIFVRKLDPNGNFIWGKSFGGNLNDSIKSVTTDNNGNVYLTGTSAGVVDLDPGSSVFNITNNSWDIFALKLSDLGEFVWAKQIGGTQIEKTCFIKTDLLNNVYLYGDYSGTIDFDPGSGISNLTAIGNTDIFLQKMDSNGVFLWVKNIGGSSVEQSSAIDISKSNSIFISGNFMGTTDFDPSAVTNTLTSFGNNDAFVQKLDSNGNLVWVKQLGGNNNDYSTSITVDTFENVYTIGGFWGTADFDPSSGVSSLTPIGNNDIFIQKMNSNGIFQWAKKLGNANQDRANSIDADRIGNVYLTGNFSGTVDFDPGIGVSELISEGNLDVFIVELDAMGELVWNFSMGATNDDKGVSIFVDKHKNIYTTGYYEGLVDFDPSLGVFTAIAPNFNKGIFVQKISLCNNTIFYDTVSACQSYTWIDGITYTSSNNTASKTFVTASGCDSVVTLNLTINSLPVVSTTLNGETITANNTSATSYKWLDCNNNYTPIPNATNQSYTATSNGSYAVEIIENGCADTSDCVDINTVSIKNTNDAIKLIAFPNPTKSTIELNFETAQNNVQIILTDVLGKEILNKKYNTLNSTKIELGYASGIYFLKVKTPNGQRIVKLVKE